ncbi:YciI family protein [Glycomyces algeriensis]|jgi:hypothetical protein|uniref:YCII-related domain-containing protein n=1 Tax=Glycomyces algeriensis TaxID=256037 RepID=A0A9W6LEG7_9ACTN|nr:YciI family protein [Glycomyces algeriensis]MDA1368387.1 YciI family protein [Glycomyces algeriensis]MDR7353193.1 hypothetical protein [Glycomyces algeriensis]GLI40887.1 hypothetical protein GALLR39Z86_07370 [Glycomyces algeriensis]
MKFLLIMNINPTVLASLTEEEQAAIGAGHGDLIKEISASGEMISTQALADPSASVTVKSVDGVPTATDGPFVEAKEFIGGYYLVDVDSKERAVELARKIPDAGIPGLGIEVRQVMFESGSEM